MEFEFRKTLSPVKMCRLHQEDADEIEKISKENEVEQAEVIRTLVHEALKEYKKSKK